MRKPYAEISGDVWKNALDYPGKVVPDVEEKPKRSDAELDAMIERQNERLRMRAIGEKILAFDNTPIAERKLMDERQERVAHQVERIANLIPVDEVMQEVAKVAKHERVTSDEVLRSANEFLKAEKYEIDKERIKFYYPLTMEEAKQFFETGKITNTDESGNLLKSSLEFTADYVDRYGQWWSGCALPGREVDRDVTLIFDKELLDEGGFTAIGKNPHAQEVDLRKCCIGAIGEHRKKDVAALRFLSRKNELALPLYERYDRDGSDMWGDVAYHAEPIRTLRDSMEGQMQQEQAIRAEVYDNVDQQGVEDTTRISLERDKNAKAEALMQLKWDLNSERERREAEQAILKYYCGLLDIAEEPWIQHYQNKSDPQGACYVRRFGARSPMIRLNEAKVDTSNLGQLVETIAHELWHARQVDMENRLDAHQLDGDAKHRAELYKYNFINYNPLDLDAEAYRKQLIEVEAYYFAGQSYKQFAQKYAEAHRPLKRVARRVKKTLGRK